MFSAKRTRNYGHFGKLITEIYLQISCPFSSLLTHLMH
jgi:hypothetical protein